jgi:hypothetical protein
LGSRLFKMGSFLKNALRFSKNYPKHRQRKELL